MLWLKIEGNCSLVFNPHPPTSFSVDLQFTMGATGKKVKGRYTFVYVYEDGEWKINHHHSSVLPEGIVTAEPITEKEVRGLFNLWNDALATLDPKKVANRYAKKGVLLPTVSDVPRTDYPGIEDYFTKFLKLKPQGKVSNRCRHTLFILKLLLHGLLFSLASYLSLDYEHYLYS